jgi:hypothetical protein
MRALNAMKSIAAAAVLCMSASAWAATSFTFVNEGVALPAVPPASNACPPPPALPLNCDITALGKAETVSGDLFSPWNFSSVFQIGNAFAVSGTFLFDDPSPANNDFFGTITGLFNPNTFSSVIDYVVTGGSGVFASGRGLGSGVVQIIPSQSGPPTYVERGQFSIPEPATVGMLAAAALLIGALRRGAQRR